MQAWRTVKSQGAVFFWRAMLSFFNVIFIISGLIIIFMGWWMQNSLDRFIRSTDEYLTALPLLLMIAGFIVILIGCSASVCMKKPCLLVTYGSCLIAFFILEVLIIILIVVFRDNIYDTFGKSLNVSMVQYSDDIKQRNQMDEIQIKFECCGYFGPDDWYHTPVHQIPPSCCKKRFCDPTKVAEIFSEGCMKIIYTYLNSNLTTVLTVAIIAGMLPLCGAFFSFCLSYHVFRASYQPVTSYNG